MLFDDFCFSCPVIFKCLLYEHCHSVCPVYIYFESCLFGLFSSFFVSSFGTSVLNVLPIRLVAGAGDPSRDGAVRNISSIIWGSPPVRRDFCSALLMVCMFRLTNPFDLGYLGLGVICLKSHSSENFCIHKK